MSISFQKLANKLHRISGQFDLEFTREKTDLLRELTTLPLPTGKSLVRYQESLLFYAAFPPNTTCSRLVQTEFGRIAELLEADIKSNKLTNTGLPRVKTVSAFSHGILKWLCGNEEYEVSIESIAGEEITLNDALRLTLPDLEKHLTSAGYSDDELFEALGVSREKRMRFLLDEFEKLTSPIVRDQIFEKLGITVAIRSRDRSFSRAFNRLPFGRNYFHDQLVRRFDHRALFDKALAGPEELTGRRKKQISTVIRHALVLLQRETDPATYLDERSLRLYNLEHGISIALYTMTPERQLPIESYVGYTLFKNGYPAAYGGAWVFGRYALFGINIHDAFRGGESGFMLCQLLRTYRQVFQIDYFEIEPYQYGKDNEEGITSGAYWFYYRFGFRSLDADLRKLASREHKKIKANSGYRTGTRTLKRFTESNCGLKLGSPKPSSLYPLSIKITAMIASRYDGDRKKAVDECRKKILKHSRTAFDPTPETEMIFTDMALVHEALNIRSGKKRALMIEMIRSRGTDVYRYQECLREFLS